MEGDGRDGRTDQRDRDGTEIVSGNPTSTPGSPGAGTTLVPGISGLKHSPREGSVAEDN